MLDLVAVLILLAALVMDQILGEPKRFHPLVGFGNLANHIEQRLNKHATGSVALAKFLGIVAWTIAVIPITLLILGIQLAFPSQSLFNSQLLLNSHSLIVSSIGFIVNAAVLYFCIAPKSLLDHSLAVYHSLEQEDLPATRHTISRIVSRDCDTMQWSDARKAAIESTLENGLDAVFAPIFWYLIFGIPGAVFYRLSNTLDAMWGYRTERFNYFGFFTAKIDDALNWIPARSVAFSYAVLGNTRSALNAWRQQASLCSSPNGGPVMSSGAGALYVQLGGSASYHGSRLEKPILGAGDLPNNNDILRANHLVQHTLYLWLAIIIISSIAVTFVIQFIVE